MPVRVKKVGKQYCVMEPGARKPKKGRCHPTRKKAVAQTSAINISLIRSGKIKPKRMPPPLKRKKK